LREIERRAIAALVRVAPAVEHELLLGDRDLLAASLCQRDRELGGTEPVIVARIEGEIPRLPALGGDGERLLRRTHGELRRAGGHGVDAMEVILAGERRAFDRNPVQHRRIDRALTPPEAVIIGLQREARAVVKDQRRARWRRRELERPGHATSDGYFRVER